ncbi:zf-HC2 domain-containing protein [Plantactinospora sp. GCM10030261]|uniref:zf-HC2 domain-containing protein n=1 Tax=Plantactinospora sp. GCM10030261 TaxID=3273420 RepID=UPI00360AE847
MRCEDCREAVSARLDGEDDPRERAAVDAHLAGCPACVRWQRDAVAVTRLARTMPLGTPAGVDDSVFAALPAPGRGRRRLDGVLRVALGVLGGIQLLLGLAQVTGFTMSHLHAGPADPYHLWHESAAWNIAVGAGFVWIAARRTPPTGLMPTLTAFVAVLAVLSINDIVTGAVGATRLLSHAMLVLGYLVLTVIHRRNAGDPGQPPAGRDRTPRWRARFDDETESPVRGRPALRLVRDLPADGHATTSPGSRAA